MTTQVATAVATAGGYGGDGRAEKEWLEEAAALRRTRAKLERQQQAVLGSMSTTTAAGASASTRTARRNGHNNVLSGEGTQTGTSRPSIEAELAQLASVRLTQVAELEREGISLRDSLYDVRTTVSALRVCYQSKR